MDKNSYFKEPVSKTEVPDYYDIIKNPICWNTIDQKLDRYEYWDLEALKVTSGFLCVWQDVGSNST